MVPSNYFPAVHSPVNHSSSIKLWEDSADGTLRVMDCELTANDISAIFQELPPTVQKLDFSQCTFTDEAFTALLNRSDRPCCEWELPWLPLEQLLDITDEKLMNVTKITFHPPNPVRAEDLDLIVEFVASLNADISIDLQHFPLTEEQKERLSDDNSSNSIDENSELVIATSDDEEHCTFELLVNPPQDKAKCCRWWKSYFSQQFGVSSHFILNDADCEIAINNPLPLIALFEVLKEEPVEKIDLTGILFSDQAWSALLQGLKGQKITGLSLDTGSLQQLQRLFAEIPLDGLLFLDISRQDYWRTTNEEKLELTRLLTEHGPKLKNLEELRLDNWNLEESHLDFIPHLSAKQIRLKNHWLKTPRQDPKLLLERDILRENCYYLGNPIDQDIEVLEVSIREWPPVLDSSESLKAFFAGIKQKNTTLIFSGIIFTDSTWEVLHQNLQNTSFVRLGFNYCQLTPRMISSLKEIPHLTKLFLEFNADPGSKSAFCRAVCEVVETLQLEELSLEYNLLNDNDLEIIFPSRLPAILNLHHNCITFQGQQYLNQCAQLSGSKRNISGEVLKRCRVDIQFNPVSRRSDTPPFEPEFAQFLKDLSSPLTHELYQRYQRMASSRPDAKERLFAHLLSTQFRIQNVPDDGNCLFHACGLGTQFTHQQLRADAVRHIRARADFFADYMEDDITLEEYALQMEQDKTWGGNVEIQALCELLKRPIVVYNKEYPLEVKDGKLVPNDNSQFPAQDNQNPIYLYHYKDCHYLRLFPKT